MNTVADSQRIDAIAGPDAKLGVAPFLQQDSALPNAAIARLHELAWRPGMHMHATWWSALALQQWQDIYAMSSVCRRAIDGLIAQRRQFPLTALKTDLDETEQHLLAIESRLPSLCVALGLAILGRGEYFLLGAYRKILQPVIGNSACDQLLVLTSNHGRLHGPNIVPERIVDEAMRVGVLRLQQELHGSLVWRALEIIFPPYLVKLDDAAHHPLRGAAVSTLFRLERFL